MMDLFEDYKKATVRPGAPRFFRRIYDQTNAPSEMLVGGMLHFNPLAGERIVIYGYAMESPYPEDREAEDQAWEHRSFMSCCFSPLEPAGEYGFTSLDTVQEISEQEFVQAKEAGWPQD